MIDSPLPRHYGLNFVVLFADYVLFGITINLLGISTVLPAFIRHFTDSRWADVTELLRWDVQAVMTWASTA